MTQTEKRGGKALKIVGAVAVVAVLIGLFKYFDINAQLRELLTWIDGLGVWGPAIFIAVYVVCCVAFVPGSIITLGAGALFGVVRGSLFVSLASISGATLAFLIGRYTLRGWVSRKIDGNAKFKAIDDAVASEGWKIVLLTRLSPVFPFTLLNYAFGLTRASARGYFFASWVGMIPGTVMYVYLGSLAGSVATIGSGERERTPQEWALFGVGLVATLVVTVFVTRVARKALAKHVG